MESKEWRHYPDNPVVYFIGTYTLRANVEIRATTFDDGDGGVGGGRTMCRVGQSARTVEEKGAPDTQNPPDRAGGEKGRLGS